MLEDLNNRLNVRRTLAELVLSLLLVVLIDQTLETILPAQNLAMKIGLETLEFIIITLIGVFWYGLLKKSI